MKEVIELDNEYVISHENGMNLQCTKNGLPWRDLTGDNMVLCMFQRIKELEAYNVELVNKVEVLLCSEDGL